MLAPGHVWNRTSVFLLIQEKLVEFLNALVVGGKHTGSEITLAPPCLLGC